MLVIVDVEADGPIPNKYSMVSFGAVIVESSLTKTFYGKVKPVSEEWIPEALAVSGISREEHKTFDDPKEVMEKFEAWLKENVKGQPKLISDNNGFDAMWITYYFHYYLGRNPFGHSSRRIGDLYCGMKMDMGVGNDWKKFKTIKHTHHPVQDAKGNAEALLKMKEMGLKMPIK
jgi:DNA polymerase III epsilon subunit-like protein